MYDISNYNYIYAQEKSGVLEVEPMTSLVLQKTSPYKVLPESLPVYYEVWDELKS